MQNNYIIELLNSRDLNITIESMKLINDTYFLRKDFILRIIKEL